MLSGWIDSAQAAGGTEQFEMPSLDAVKKEAMALTKKQMTALAKANKDPTDIVQQIEAALSPICSPAPSSAPPGLVPAARIGPSPDPSPNQ